MDCEDALTRSAELSGSADLDRDGADPDAAAHLRTCGACRVALAEAEDALVRLQAAEAANGPDLPPTDVAALLTAARTARRPRLTRLRTLARAAVVVLAVAGAAAVCRARVTVADGRATFEIASPWATARSEGGAADATELAALRRDLGDELRDALATASRDAAARDTAQATLLCDALREVAARDDGAHETVVALARELVALRRDVAEVQWFQRSLVDATVAAPSLPDPE